MNRFSPSQLMVEKIASVAFCSWMLLVFHQILTSSVYAAQMYLYKDSDGVTHLSDAPPVIPSWQQNEVRVRNYTEYQTGNTTSPPTLRKDYTIPFAKNRGGIIVVDAMINRSIMARMLVDTGASVIMITKELASRITHTSRSSPEAVTIEGLGGSIQGEFMMIPRLEIGNVARENIAAVVMKKGAGFKGPFDGLLGMNFLGDFELSIDYANSLIIMKEKDHLKR